jgi:SRSO17 transposase
VRNDDTRLQTERNRHTFCRHEHNGRQPFQTKPAIALEQIRQAVKDEVTPAPVLADAAYGNDAGFRAGLEELQLQYVVGVQSSTTVWPPGTGPLPAKPWSGQGRPPSRLGRDAQHAPLSVKELALCLTADDFHRVSWSQGSQGKLRSRCAAESAPLTATTGVKPDTKNCGS